MTDFLTAELAHAETQLARVRRIAAKMQADLEAQGLDEVTVYERLAANKAHRQLQRDEAFYQQMCLRLLRHLSRTPQAPATSSVVTPNPPSRPVATPSRNQFCPCGSGVKYKRCCGKFTFTHNAAA